MKRTLTILTTILLFACQREESSKQSSGIPPYSPPAGETAATATPTATQAPTQTPSPIQVTTEAGPPIASPPSTDSAPRIEIAQLQQAIAANDVVVVDVRSTDSYAKGHIKGAIHIPEGEVALRASTLPRNKMIVTYCT